MTKFYNCKICTRQYYNDGKTIAKLKAKQGFTDICLSCMIVIKEDPNLLEQHRINNLVFT